MPSSDKLFRNTDKNSEDIKKCVLVILFYLLVYILLVPPGSSPSLILPALFLIDFFIFWGKSKYWLAKNYVFTIQNKKIDT